ncbi:MAG: alkaline phosphatase family protein, partial [Halobacterium sp.]
MLDADLAATLADDGLAEGFLRPDYDGFCFSRVPATAASFVGADVGSGLPERAMEGVETDAERVVVVFLDSL